MKWEDCNFLNKDANNRCMFGSKIGLFVFNVSMTCTRDDCIFMMLLKKEDNL